MENLSLIELYQIKKRLIKEGLDTNLLDEVKKAIQIIENKIYEDVSSISSAYPSSGIAGETIGMNWASGGSDNPGEISVPYNPGGTNRMHQKLEMGKNHGARTGKKSREKKVDIKALRSALAKRKDFKPSGERKVMSFDNFQKDQMNVVKR